jgi:hypothetical protein
MKRFVLRLMGLRPRFLVMASALRMLSARRYVNQGQNEKKPSCGICRRAPQGQDRVHVASALAFGVTGLLAENRFRPLR